MSRQALHSIRIWIGGKTASKVRADRKGTMVHPDFQKRGFGSVLTRHCNAIMDKTGDRTFVPARPTSIKMFKDNGFKVVGFHDSHLERWGGPVEKSKTWLAIREAPSP